MAETEAVVGRLDQRLAEIRNELTRLDGQAIDKAHLTQTLAQFEPLWEVLTERERARVVHLMVQSAEFDSQSGDVAVAFHVDASPCLAPPDCSGPGACHF